MAAVHAASFDEPWGVDEIVAPGSPMRQSRDEILDAP